MTTSFPFLKIARDHGIPYGAVVRMSDVVVNWMAGVEFEPTDEQKRDVLMYGFMSMEVLEEISDAVETEQARRESV